MNDIKSILLREEGIVLRPYKCPAGFLTIGVGRNLETTGITQEEAFYLLENDIKRAVLVADEFDWYHLLSPGRQAVVISMIFQLGAHGFNQFRKMIAALNVGDYDLAAKEMLDSVWAKQTPDRAARMQKMMIEG